jgi:hypothetical protein
MIWIIIGIALVVLAIIKYKERQKDDFEQREN